MSNVTDPAAHLVRGGNPQNLLEKITRQRIYECMYWKEECFGLSAETLVDKAIELKYIGGTYGGMRKPAPFLCLILKMLQIQPDKEIIIEFIKQEDHKYIRALGLFYMRLFGKETDVFNYLEPCLLDYRKLRMRDMYGWHLTTMDQLTDLLMREKLVFDVTLPTLVPRVKLEEAGRLEPRKSPIEDELYEEFQGDAEANKPEESGMEEVDGLEEPAGGRGAAEEEGALFPDANTESCLCWVSCTQ